MPDQTRIPAGRLDLEVVAPQRWEGWGKVSLGLLVRVNDRLEKNLTIHADVEAFTEMVVTTRPLQAGTVIEAGDLAIQKREITSANSKFSKNMDEAIGKKLRQTLRENSPLRVDQLEKVPVVRTGQLVTIVAESSSLRISISGRAKGNGAVGDQIMVQNLTSLKDIPAIIVDANTVAVGF
jgi:flagella basal body P-ring formation protein FlgA